MTNLDHPTRDFDESSIVLRGGPADLPDSLRSLTVSSEQEKVKVSHRGGYEHFERTSLGRPVDDGSDDAVFDWTMRTRVAE